MTKTLTTLVLLLLLTSNLFAQDWGMFASSMDKWDQNKPINFKLLDFSVGSNYIKLATKDTGMTSISFGNSSVGYLTQHGKVFRIRLK